MQVVTNASRSVHPVGPLGLHKVLYNDLLMNKITKKSLVKCEGFFIFAMESEWQAMLAVIWLVRMLKRPCRPTRAPAGRDFEAGTGMPPGLPVQTFPADFVAGMMPELMLL